jgi:hypothetical protein
VAKPYAVFIEYATTVRVAVDQGGGKASVASAGAGKPAAATTGAAKTKSTAVAKSSN